MHARLVQSKIVTGQAYKFIAKMKELAIPHYEAQPGFESAYLMVDRDNETSVLLTIFDTVENLAASEKYATHRIELDGVRDPPEVTYFEVIEKV